MYDEVTAVAGWIAESNLSVKMKLPEVILIPLAPEDREQFILDNQWAFKYGAQQEFGMRDDRCEEGEEVISRKTIERSIDGENTEAYRIVLNGQKVGGVVLQIDKEAAKGDLELLFVLPECHSKGIGQAAWKAVEAMHPEIRVWETITPYFEKRNIHFYVNRCGFHIVEFWNKHHHGPAVPEEMEENWSEEDEMFVFRKKDVLMPRECKEEILAFLDGQTDTLELHPRMQGGAVVDVYYRKGTDDAYARYFDYAEFASGTEYPLQSVAPGQVKVFESYITKTKAL